MLRYLLYHKNKYFHILRTPVSTDTHDIPVDVPI